MQIFQTTKSIKDYLRGCRENSQSVALVPTMGGLHEGHLSLIDKAKKSADIVVVSIFINPTQFTSGEDFEKYPKSKDDDINKLKQRKIDALFLPKIIDIYPDSKESDYDVGLLGRILCGMSRPTHFNGVAQVVAKFFDIIEPDFAVFGKKDYQQLVIIKDLVNKRYKKIKILSTSIVREADGLAMSTRNKYLDVKERATAAQFYQALKMAHADIESGRDIGLALKKTRSELSKSFEIDYVEILDANTLTEITPNSAEIIIISAVRLGVTRLIDNIVLRRMNV